MEKDSTPVYIVGIVTASTRREHTIRCKDRHDKLRDVKLPVEHLLNPNDGGSGPLTFIKVPKWWAHQNKIPFYLNHPLDAETSTMKFNEISREAYVEITLPAPIHEIDLTFHFKQEPQMNLTQYQPLAMRTAKIMDADQMLVHGAMGCGSEAGEFALTAAKYTSSKQFDFDNAKEEIGDGFWFLTYVAETLGLNVHHILRGGSDQPMKISGASVDPYLLSQHTLMLNAHGADIITVIKARQFYGKALDVAGLEAHLFCYGQALMALCAVCGFTVSEVLAANIAKLSKRYADKYSDVAAIARADKAEVTHVAVVDSVNMAQPTGAYIAANINSADDTMERSVGQTFSGHGGSFDGGGATANFESSPAPSDSGSSASPSID